MADLKVAVERISSRSNEGDNGVLVQEMQGQIEAALAQIDQLRRRRAELRARLVDARTAEVTPRSFAGSSGTLAEMARTYRDQAEAHAWLTTLAQPEVTNDAPLTGQQATRWLELLRDVEVTANEAEAAGRLVDLAWFPTPTQFAALLDRYSAAKAGHDAVTDWIRQPAFAPVSALATDERAGLQQRLGELARQVVGFEQRGEQWMAHALHDIRTGRASTWQSRAEHIHGLLGSVWPGLQQLGPATRVTVAAGADRAAIGALAEYLRSHVQGGGSVKLNPDGSVKLGAFSGKAIKNSSPLFEAVQVDGRPPTTAEQLTAVLTHLDVERHLAALDQAWPAEVQVPQEDTLQERFQWHATELGQLQALLTVGQEIAAEQRRFEELQLPQPNWNDLKAVLAFAHLVDAASARDAYAAAAAPLQELAAASGQGVQQPGAAPVCGALDDAVRFGNRGAYVEAYERIRWLFAIRQLVAERDALTARVAAAAPALAAAVTSSLHEQTWTQRIPALAQAWDWARVGSWILRQETEDANELQQQLDVAEDSLRAAIERLAGVRAWRHALAPTRLSGQSRADLNQYVRLVKRLGKGGGKYGDVRRAEIRQAMDRCRPAVPVWIMPIYRIAEQLHVSENMFDVVIVDEASQAGLEATFLQYVAPKIVVIGDDKQVSPSAVGVDQQKLRDLANQFLPDHRYKESWQDPKMSLFDAASIWFGNKRTLIEHRRCVPEIIEFSNRIAYEPDNIRLVPVRQFGADRLEPVRAVRVTDGFETGGSGTKVNRPEADAIVSQIEKCLADPRYDDKTFGVISLLGPRQAKVINDLLLERIAPEEWVARDLRCGDAPAFQGSERDVMFLSMVSAPEPGQRMGALTVEANVQRYNVAASRAKDQMWVFHSVALEQLTNPEDMRFQLLDYCYHGVRGLRVDDSGAFLGMVHEDRRVEPFDSLFEQRVHNRLVQRGYTVLPQFDSMGYRIDLVVVGAKGRLAVECDGDYWHGPDQYIRDLARERDLRRCGWQFFRIKESAFYVDEHAVLSKLWATLDELEIKPAGWSDAVEGSDEEVDSHAADDHDGEGALDEDLDIVSWSTIEDGVAEVVPLAALSPSAAAPAVVGSPEEGVLLPYEKYTGSAPPAAEAARRDLEQILIDIVAVEGPVMGFRIHSAYVAASGGQRVGPAIAQTLNSALTRLLRRGALVASDPLGRAGMRPRTFRLPEQPLVVQRELGPRDLAHVPPHELAALLRDAAEVTAWSSPEALYREALRRLGRVRLTPGVLDTMASVVDLARTFDEGAGGEGADARLA